MIRRIYKRAQQTLTTTTEPNLSTSLYPSKSSPQKAIGGEAETAKTVAISILIRVFLRGAYPIRPAKN